MARELRCRDVGPDCDAVVVGESDSEILRQAAQHAQEVHGMREEEIKDPDFIAHVRSQIRVQDSGASVD